MSRKVRLLACMLAVGLAFMASPTQAHAIGYELHPVNMSVGYGSDNDLSAVPRTNRLQPIYDVDLYDSGLYSNSSATNPSYSGTSLGQMTGPAWYTPTGMGAGTQNRVLWVCMFSGSSMCPKGSKVYLNCPLGFCGTRKYQDGSWYPLWYGYFHLFVTGVGETDDVIHEVPVSDDGSFVMPVSVRRFCFVWDHIYIPTSSTAGRDFLILAPQVFVDTGQTTNDIEQQTDTMMDTTGSDSVLDSALGSGESALTDRLGFVGQAMSIPNAFFTGVTSDADSVVHFPGISVMGLNIPAADIDIWSALPNLETPCKTICTFVFIVAWFRGIQAIYGRIVQGDKVVTIEGAD